MATVALIGTLDTKGLEYAFLRERLTKAGVRTIVIDVGVFEPKIEADIPAVEIARAGGRELADLRMGERGEAISCMAAGATAVLADLFHRGLIDGVLALGGSGGSSAVAPAMQALPFGVPKVLVSTMASGDTRSLVGAADVMLIYPIVDISGINRISARVLANAASAVAGMVSSEPPSIPERPLVAATMFGVTTPCITIARERLEELGYEVLVFHATGIGGRSMENLIRSGFIVGVLDVTTTELADELVGGVLSAGPDRLEAAGKKGIPQVVSLGALDMVNFGALNTVPERFTHRKLHVHNENVTLMRTTPDECAQLGRVIGRKLSASTGPTVLFIPLHGLSQIGTENQPFYDPAADGELFSSVRRAVEPHVEVHEVPTHINDPAFAIAMADRLHELLIEVRHEA